MTRDYYVYILTNNQYTVLYTGVTNDLERRVEEHKQGITPGFTNRYNVNKLVYYESTSDVQEALEREKQLKRWRRAKKVALIESLNPDWRDLADGWSSSQPDPSTGSG